MFSSMTEMSDCPIEVMMKKRKVEKNEGGRKMKSKTRVVVGKGDEDVNPWEDGPG